MSEEEIALVDTSAKKKKKEKKERKKEEKKKNKKRKKSDGDDDSDGEPHVSNDISENIIDEETKDEEKKPKKKKMKEAKSRLKSKKEEKAELMKKVPLRDEHGIAYTKFQVRQMLKRVKKGLPPVATAQELDEKRQNEARLRREEEAELAGLTSTRNANDSDDELENSDAGDEDVGEIYDANDGEKNSDEDEVPNDAAPASESCTPVPSAQKGDGAAQKKAKRNKPVPSDYVCQACKNRHTPAHWIYDCPDKVTVRGTNKKRKKERGINDPDSRKVFVSGLPFEAKPKAVEDFFSVTKNCGTVASVRLIKFPDTGRCNGQAYVSFDTDEGAQRAIGLSGTMIDPEVMSSSPDFKKKKDIENSAPRRELKLKVSKVLNRKKTKRA
jgi:hypothetical protein